MYIPHDAWSGWQSESVRAAFVLHVACLYYDVSIEQGDFVSSPDVPALITFLKRTADELLAFKAVLPVLLRPDLPFRLIPGPLVLIWYALEFVDSPTKAKAYGVFRNAPPALLLELEAEFRVLDIAAGRPVSPQVVDAFITAWEIDQRFAIEMLEEVLGEK